MDGTGRTEPAMASGCDVFCEPLEEDGCNHVCEPFQCVQERKRTKQVVITQLTCCLRGVFHDTVESLANC